MRFFDTKEEVIDIQLTMHGKMLLSEGKLNPVYYTFFDNDVIYDASYADREEAQNNAEGRIRNETPRLKAQCNFVSPESTAGTNGHRKSLTDLHYGAPMGRSALDSEYAPAWSVDYLYGELTGSTTYLTGSGGTNLTSSILQLDSKIQFESYVTHVKPNGDLKKNYIPNELEPVTLIFGYGEDREAGNESGDLPPEEFESMMMQRQDQAADDTLLQVRPDFLLLEVAESNVDFIKENFEIEVYEITTEKNDIGKNVSTTRSLKFFDFSDPNATLSTDHVEYYFDISTDNDIPTEFFCASSVIPEKRKDMLIDDPYPTDCPDFAATKNLYVTELEDIEEPC